uniref:Uncharacterized protein n=1 Tax=Cacopsylla melanoneura TaxID=428564 RepID=A0A8D8YNJ0_9HEMI
MLYLLSHFTFLIRKYPKTMFSICIRTFSVPTFSAPWSLEPAASPCRTPARLTPHWRTWFEFQSAVESYVVRSICQALSRRLRVIIVSIRALFMWEISGAP